MVGTIGGSVAIVIGMGTGKMSSSTARQTLAQSMMGGAGIGATIGAFVPAP